MSIVNDEQRRGQASDGRHGVLGGAGATRPIASDNWESHGLYGFNSRDIRSRPFNLLRAQVLKSVQAEGARIVGVTSPTPRVGKSFVASNLAASLSRIPTMDTLLVDLDLRRGSIARIFGIEDGTGISAYLAGDVPEAGATARQVEGGRLTILPCFPSEHSSAELLAAERMAQLIAAMRALPDNTICICDLPPAFANDDASIVLRDIDGYLMIVEEGRTTAQQVRDSIEVLKPATCIGTVLNRYRGGIGGDNYGFGYGSNRDYAAYYSN